MIRAIRTVPAGQTCSYGQIAAIAGYPGRARFVGNLLSALSDDEADVPWHRIINAQGRVSLPEPHAAEQRARLRAEGVRFRRSGIVHPQHRWQPHATSTPDFDPLLPA